MVDNKLIFAKHASSELPSIDRAEQTLKGNKLMFGTTSKKARNSNQQHSDLVFVKENFLKIMKINNIFTSSPINEESSARKE
eukprot:CAMPEP_0168325414 /NCGR_PEP_ID=MMETSP0213-20121227/4678_1 /TAXON_ID=151035 /ORGANISM="Euplotes harpa, Strain FSP1.4" /LENGTH=81 /DNA_ID=CAMNT_0008327903 /DNA_START=190 /DNA_END=432 /DNA_ORIENTATION=+